MKVFLGCKIPGKFTGITLWPFGIYLEGDTVSFTNLNHETIHWHQQKELPVLFYVFYVLFWILGVIKKIFNKNVRSYKDNPFELEAKGYEDDLTYPYSRKRFAWKKYLKDFLKFKNYD